MVDLFERQQLGIGGGDGFDKGTLRVKSARRSNPLFGLAAPVDRQVPHPHPPVSGGGSSVLSPLPQSPLPLEESTYSPGFAVGVHPAEAGGTLGTR